jgi:serine/threonine protein kinase
MKEFSRDERAEINDVVADALELPPDKRAELVRKRCSDERLRAEVLRLLENTASTQSIANVADRGTRSGETVGPFRLQQRLGRGASGEVYLAIRLDVGQKAALKILQAGSGNALDEKQFEQEARLLAGLDHRNIIRLLDYGRTNDGHAYLAMEYIAGGHLVDWCDRQRLTVKERVRLFVKVCHAVQYTHDHLLIHRDLKPENILVDAQGEPKLADFGIVRMIGPATTLMVSTEIDADLQNRMAGTLEYASPEQFSRGPISTASDVYGLGAVLYEILSGRVPLKIRERGPETVAGFIQRLRTEAAPPASSIEFSEAMAGSRNTTPQELRRSLDGDLDAILMKALAKSPRERYANAGSLADDLDRYLERLPISAREGGFVHRLSRFYLRNKLPVSAAAAAVILLFGGAAGIMKENQRLSRADAERSRTISSIMRAAMSFEKGINELERQCNPGHAKAALDSAEARMKSDPSPDSAFHAARCRRIFAEFLLGSKDETERKTGYQLLQKAVALLADLRSKNPNYGGLDEEWTALDGDQSRLRAGQWTTSGIGFAAEPTPPVLAALGPAYDEARVARRLADLWRTMGDSSRAALLYEQALASYDEALGRRQDPSLAAERVECRRLLDEARAGGKSLGPSGRR